MHFLKTGPATLNLAVNVLAVELVCAAVRACALSLCVIHNVLVLVWDVTLC